jgi:gamma-glutamyltranspeptidase/glutathione hydrolase
MNLPAAVAAHHPATAAAGLDLLAAGGSAADAAVGAMLAACVAESYMTGLAGGGHAIVWDARQARARTFDFFVAVPGLEGVPDASDPVALPITFETETVPYTVGAGSVGVPGVPAGLEHLWRHAGRLPWPSVVEPALKLARSGVGIPPTHANVLAMVGQAMTLGEGSRVYAPQGRLLAAGELLDQPGLVTALELLRDEGADSYYRGTAAKLLVELMREQRTSMTEMDLEAYRVVEADPAEVTFAGRRVLSRRDLNGMLGALDRLPPLGGLAPAPRALALVAAITGDDLNGHTTNVSATDPQGNACVITTSLGLGSGDWVPGLDIHLNSMLGEVELQRGVPVPGERMGSMVVPTLVMDDDGLAVAVGAAGGSRIRSAMVQVLSGLLAEGRDPVQAVEERRLHPAGRQVHAEPGFDASALAALEEAGYDVRRWRTQHHYFGGVSLVARDGAAADTRRDGTALRLEG